MNDTYVECLVKRQPKPILNVCKFALIFLTAVIGFFSVLVFGSMIGFIAAIALGVGAYFVNVNSDIEYEYLYVDREITIDKVMAKTRRKRIAKYDVEKIEVLAPINSYHLDEFKNRQTKNLDFSTGEPNAEHRFVFYYEGQQRIIIDPSAEFVKAVYNIAPRKVFTD